MSADPKDRVARLATNVMPDFLKANPIEEDIAKIQFSGVSDAAPETDATAGETDRSEVGRSAAIELSLRAGEVMKVLFPDGLHLKSDTDFAVFRAFDRMIRNVAEFAQSGMRADHPLREISSDAVSLASMLSGKARP